MDTANREMAARDLLTAMCLGSKARNSDWCILKGQEVLTVESAIEAMLAFVEASQLSGVVGERDEITVAMLKAAANATGCPISGEVGPKNREFFTQIYRAMRDAALSDKTGGQS